MAEKLTVKNVSENQKADRKISSGVLVALIICGTITLLSFAGMAYGAIFYNQFRDDIRNIKEVRIIDADGNKQIEISRDENSVQVTTPNQQSANDAKYIGEEKAADIALSDAKVNRADAKNLRAYLDRDDGKVLYEVEFVSSETEFDYEIDATSGKILDASRESIYD